MPPARPNDPSGGAAARKGDRPPAASARIDGADAPENTDKMTPADLKARRQRLGLSQGQLAQALGMAGRNGERTVRRWESGEYDIPGPVALALTALEHGLSAD